MVENYARLLSLQLIFLCNLNEKIIPQKIKL